ncbi:hypothetical protein HBH79_216210 [Parastagonospora nodorum]|nr:hypothetical protein HBI01_158780 [Parastagonospora nodorum]KAH4321541.1 hypothetical protein HBI00_212680 [Parastagonospora nodorum]KAH4444490.1 hypothetical protein HBH90_220130 [Parastagonospora nodorum]KAH4650731.1 hypothetical protein HBH80_212460 [Parastagonospora nodorum]KAH4655770.1 hypothetical protein HBH79_216210 [Parastagonospora nodorum]
MPMSCLRLEHQLFGRHDVVVLLWDDSLSVQERSIVHQLQRARSQVNSGGRPFILSRIHVRLAWDACTSRSRRRAAQSLEIPLYMMRMCSLRGNASCEGAMNS